jgi:5'-nucleotidase
VVLASLIAALAACAAPREHARPTRPIHLVVLHTNDIHGQILPRKATWLDKDHPPMIGGLPRVAAYINRVRAEERDPDEAVIAVDGGDWYQGTPEGVIDRGLECVKAIAAIHYDAASLGNHEFDHGLANLQRLLSEGHPPAICCNLRIPTSGKRVPWVEPWRIVDACGLRVALVGLLTPATPSITHKDAGRLIFEDPVVAITHAKEELAGQYDLMIPVGHIGLDDGARIAKVHPELALIVTGHSHTYLKQGQREGDTLLVQAGSKAAAVGRVDLWFDPTADRVTESKARLIDLTDEPAAEYRNAKVDAICDKLVAQSAVELEQVVGELTQPLRAGKGPFSTIAGDWMADLMRARTGADVGIHNRGGTRAEIEAGPVTRRAVFEVWPFDNNVVTVSMTGEQLANCVRQSIEGTAHSGLDFSGLRAFVDVSIANSKPALKLTRIEIGGRELDRAHNYRVAMNSFLADGGDSYEDITHAHDRSEDPILLRDLALEEFVRAHKVTPPADQRIVDNNSTKP